MYGKGKNMPDRSEKECMIKLQFDFVPVSQKKNVPLGEIRHRFEHGPGLVENTI